MNMVNSAVVDRVLAEVQYKITESDLVLIKQLCLPDKIIGGNLGISPANVSMRISRLGVRLGVENRTTIIVRALELGLVTINQLVYRKFFGSSQS